MLVHTFSLCLQKFTQLTASSPSTASLPDLVCAPSHGTFHDNHCTVYIAPNAETENLPLTHHVHTIPLTRLALHMLSAKTSMSEHEQPLIAERTFVTVTILLQDYSVP